MLSLPTGRRRPPVSPDLRLRAHAAGAWALGSAARKWPDRYRKSAIQAVRALGPLEDAASGAGTASSSDLTAALVGTAYRAASSLGVSDLPGDAHSGGVPVADRLTQPQSAGGPTGSRVAMLAAKVLANASRF